MKITLHHTFEDIISIDNLLLAWQEFKRGKQGKRDVQEFRFNLMDNILSLHRDLVNKKYRHGPYHQFRINDPKPRIIHKATVRDRFLHHAVYRILYPFFDKKFIADSFSCRNNKGTHRAVNRFRKFHRTVSKNSTKTCWVLKCDIKNFFHSIDQQKLISILREYIPDFNIINLLTEIIFSFNAKQAYRGLPLGNLTSQLFCNIYMDNFDQYLKHKLKAKYYVRYADDFVVLSESKRELEGNVTAIKAYLENKLHLSLHPDKIIMKTIASGIDFLGWVHFSDHRIVRSATKRRLLKRLKQNKSLATVNSYLGLLSHGNTQRIRDKVMNMLTGL